MYTVILSVWLGDFSSGNGQAYHSLYATQVWDDFYLSRGEEAMQEGSYGSSLSLSNFQKQAAIRAKFVTYLAA